MRAGARQRVLIVEDNVFVGETIAEACRGWGYHAFSAPDAISAAEWLDRGAFDLLIVDYGLPGGVSGEEVLRQYRSCNPGGAALVISGMTLPSEPPATPTRFLQKPFTIAQLGAALTALWDACELRAVA